MSASGLTSTMPLAIDQILRLAPSIRPAIEPGRVEDEGDLDAPARPACIGGAEGDRRGRQAQKRDAKGVQHETSPCFVELTKGKVFPSLWCKTAPKTSKL